MLLEEGQTAQYALRGQEDSRNGQMPRRKIVDLEIPSVQFPVPTERQESVQRLLPGKAGQSGHTVHTRCDPIEFRFWITIF